MGVTQRIRHAWRTVRAVAGDVVDRAVKPPPADWAAYVTSYGEPNTERITQAYEQYALHGYGGNGPVFSVIDTRRRLFSEARFKWRRLSDKRLFGGAGLALLEKPWPNGTTGELLARMELDVSLAGNAYIRRAGDRLERLRPDWVTIVSWVVEGADGHQIREVIGYIYDPVGDPDREIDFFVEDEVAHWAPIPDPLANWRGMSWLTPVLAEINADRSMTEHRDRFFRNAATPNLILKYAHKLSPQQRNDIANAVAARHAGPVNAGGTLVLDQGADPMIVGAKFSDAQFEALQAAGENRIATAGGVPALVVGLKEGLQAAAWSMYRQAMRAFADLTMRPNWRGACAALSKVVEVPAGAELWFDTADIAALQEGEQESASTMQTQAATASTLIQAGYEPDSVVTALVAGDMTLLKHTGLFSVQLRPPGPEEEPGPDEAGDSPPGQPGPDEPDEADGDGEQRDGEDAAPAARSRREIERRFDPSQPRDRHGRWTDGAPWADVIKPYGETYDEEWIDGVGAMIAFENGESAFVAAVDDDRYRVLFDGLDADELEELADALRWAGTEDISDLEPSPNGLLDWQLVGRLRIGIDQAGDVSIAALDDDGAVEGQADLSAEEAVDLAEASRRIAARLDELAETGDEPATTRARRRPRRDEIQRRFNPDQPRDRKGRWTDELGVGDLVDKLRLAEKLSLGPGERVLASRRSRAGGYTDHSARMALLDTPEGPDLRLGVTDKSSWAAAADGKTARFRGESALALAGDLRDVRSRASDLQTQYRREAREAYQRWVDGGGLRRREEWEADRRERIAALEQQLDAIKSQAWGPDGVRPLTTEERAEYDRVLGQISELEAATVEDWAAEQGDWAVGPDWEEMGLEDVIPGTEWGDLFYIVRLTETGGQIPGTDLVEVDASIDLAVRPKDAGPDWRDEVFGREDYLALEDLAQMDRLLDDVDALFGLATRSRVHPRPAAQRRPARGRWTGAVVARADNALKRYWTKSPDGLAKWVDHPHPWTALYRQLRKHLGSARAKRVASAWFKDVFGIWPGERGGDNPTGPG